MKTILLIGAATGLFLGMAAAPIIAQTQTTTTNTSSSGGYVQTSKIVGMKVKTAQGEEVGEVKDVVLDRSTGCMAYTVLSTGGTGTRVTGSAKTVAVPWSVYSVSPDARVLTVQVDRERIYNAPVFDYARIDEFSSPTYINNVYTYYGVSAQAGFSAQAGYRGQTTSVQGTNTTGVNTNVNANTNPGTSPAQTTGYSGYGAAPTAAGSPAPATSPATATSAAVNASPVVNASPAASPEETKSNKVKSHAPRRHNETMKEQGTEEGTSAETKSSRHHATEEGAESSASPSKTKSTKHHTKTEEGTTTEEGASPKGTPPQE